MRISAETWELLRQLHEKNSVWGKLFDSGERAVRLVEKICSGNEAAAIPHFAGLLLDRRVQVREAVARAIHKLVSSLEPMEFVRLDEACRGKWFYSPLGYARWSDIEPYQLKNFAKLPHPIELMGVTSFHPSGFVRAEAVAQLGKNLDGSELPFLLVRLNDWVEPVRNLAMALVRSRISIEYARHFLYNLALVWHLRSCGRTQNTDFTAEVAKLLKSPSAHDILREGIKSPDRWLRRESFRLAIETKTADSTKLIKEVLSDDDSILRLLAARNLLERLPVSELKGILPKLLADSSAPVRCEGLIIAANQLNCEGRNYLLNALLDSHGSVRAAARYHLQSAQVPVDFADYYRQALSAGSLTKQRTAILGLGETGSASDCVLLLPFTRLFSVPLKRATIRSIAILDLERHVALVMSALSDEHASVSMQAANALLKRRTVLDFDRVKKLFRESTLLHVRKNAFKLLLALPFWERGIFLFVAIRDNDPTIVGMGLRSLSDWISKTSSFASGPTHDELERLNDSLKASFGMLSEQDRKRFAFWLEDLGSN